MSTNHNTQSIPPLSDEIQQLIDEITGQIEPPAHRSGGSRYAVYPCDSDRTFYTVAGCNLFRC